MIISLMNQKGGVGKTTLAIHIAYMLKMLGEDVILADTDPQGSLIKWDGIRSKLEDIEYKVPTVNVAHGDLVTSIRQLGQKYPFVIVDSPPRLSELGRAVVAVSDIVLMPVKPSGLDFLATIETVDIVKEVRILRPEVIAVFIFNSKKNTQLSKIIQKKLEAMDVELLDQAVGDRTAYAEGCTFGYTAMEIDPNPHSKHHQEMMHLINGIMRLAERGKVISLDAKKNSPNQNKRVLA